MFDLDPMALQNILQNESFLQQTFVKPKALETRNHGFVAKVTSFAKRFGGRQCLSASSLPIRFEATVGSLPHLR
jgi:hypothetical protein